MQKLLGIRGIQSASFTMLHNNKPLELNQVILVVMGFGRDYQFLDNVDL
jgi:hypothetical protein